MKAKIKKPKRTRPVSAQFQKIIDSSIGKTRQAPDLIPYAGHTNKAIKKVQRLTPAEHRAVRQHVSAINAAGGFGPVSQMIITLTNTLEQTVTPELIEKMDKSVPLVACFGPDGEPIEPPVNVQPPVK